jgi:hypothetical protein
VEPLGGLVACSSNQPKWALEWIDEKAFAFLASAQSDDGRRLGRPSGGFARLHWCD